MIFPLNKAAVYLQKKDYENCIATCHKAIEVGQENRADFQKLAKAYARIAKAYQAQEKYEDSLHFYDKALANHRDQDYVKQRKAIEKVFKEQQRLAYIDPAKSEEAKKRGNDFFREGLFLFVSFNLITTICVYICILMYVCVRFFIGTCIAISNVNLSFFIFR